MIKLKAWSLGIWELESEKVKVENQNSEIWKLDVYKLPIWKFPNWTFPNWKSLAPLNIPTPTLASDHLLRLQDVRHEIPRPPYLQADNYALSWFFTVLDDFENTGCLQNIIRSRTNRFEDHFASPDITMSTPWGIAQQCRNHNGMTASQLGAWCMLDGWWIMAQGWLMATGGMQQARIKLLGHAASIRY